jgi:4-hydroxy-4-methyl-2-oxoglutarate aldolase
VRADAALLRAGTATLGEAWPAARIVDAPIRPLATGMAAAGPALTVRCRPGDNMAIHLAIAAAQPGDVLVVDYGGSTGSGPFGEVMALACRMRGIAGLVIDGAVRDSAQIAALGFPVFARGLNIRGTTKLDRGEIGGSVVLGGVAIAAGDIVVADADAVVVLSAGDLAGALAAAEARMARKARMMDRLRQGETTLSILGLAQEDRA